MDPRRALKAACRALVGRPASLPPAVLARFPMLQHARWRVGGLPPRLGGWALGARSVAGIALGRTVFLAPHATIDPWLLLHEFAHVLQFARVRGFPVRYVWESLRHGYRANRFEREANAYADQLLAERPPAGA